MDKCNHSQDCEVYKSASRHLVLTYNDFAMECFKQRYFGDAVTLLNKAISEEKNEKGLYLNRGGQLSTFLLVRWAYSEIVSTLCPTNHTQRSIFL